MRVPTVSNMESPRSGNPVANQFIISTEEGETFQSYRTPIAKNNGGVFTISSNYNYSVTTNRYFTQWLRSFGLDGEDLTAVKKWLKSAKDGDQDLSRSRFTLKYVEEL